MALRRDYSPPNYPLDGVMRPTIDSELEKARELEKGGAKFDDNKVRLDLVPPELIFAVGDILTFGAKKYADRNWERGMDWGRVFGALMRHLWKWWGGALPTTENFLFGNLDDETGKSHLWHAACCIAFLIAYESRGVGNDTRGGA